MMPEFARMSHNGSQNGAREGKHVARITLEWSQSGDRIVPEWARMCQNEASRMGQAWTQNYGKTCQNGQKCVRMMPPECARMGQHGQEWAQHGLEWTRMVPECCQNESERSQNVVRMGQNGIE